MAQQELVAKELAHRVNNTLAVVMGLFQHSQRKSTDLESLAETFVPRLLAMSNANSALVRSMKGSADLETLAKMQLGPFLEQGRLTIEGPRVALDISRATSMALALNELATNATKYGALSNPCGSVSLRWTAEASPEAEAVLIEWREQAGPPVRHPTRTGMGSRLIENGIAGATVERRFDPSGLSCSIKISLAHS